MERTRKARAPALALALFAMTGAACPRGGDDGGPAPPDESPERIVSLTPSATEIVAAAGGLEALVGVDRFSSYPDAVADLPEVGDFMRPSFEAIARLEPDLVVLEEAQRRVVPSLEGAGIDTLILDIHDLGDVQSGLARVGERLGDREPAERAIARIESALEEAAAARETRDGAPRVLLVVDRELGGLGDLVAAGPGTYLDELAAAAGAENAFADAGDRYIRTSPEGVVAAGPEIIIETNHDASPGDALDDWRELEAVPAVQRERLYVLEESYYAAPGPRADEALRGLRAVIAEE